MLHLLLVSHLFDKIGDLLHGRLHLRHDALFTVKRRLVSPSQLVLQHFVLLIIPATHFLFSFDSELGLIFELGSQILVHRLERACSRVCVLLETLVQVLLVVA